MILLRVPHLFLLIVKINTNSQSIVKFHEVSVSGTTRRFLIPTCIKIGENYNLPATRPSKSYDKYETTYGWEDEGNLSYLVAFDKDKNKTRLKSYIAMTPGHPPDISSISAGLNWAHDTEYGSRWDGIQGGTMKSLLYKLIWKVDLLKKMIFNCRPLYPFNNRDLWIYFSFHSLSEQIEDAQKKLFASWSPDKARSYFEYFEKEYQ